MKNFASKYGPKVDDLRSQRVKPELLYIFLSFKVVNIFFWIFDKFLSFIFYNHQISRTSEAKNRHRDTNTVNLYY